jgi:hypothetical protein
LVDVRKWVVKSLVRTPSGYVLSIWDVSGQAMTRSPDA